MAWGGRSGRAFRFGLSAFAIAGAASAQQSRAPGADLYLDFKTGIISSDNYESIQDPSGPSTFLSSDIVLGYESVTAAQQLAFRIGSSYQVGTFADDPGSRGGWTDPFAQLDYQHVSANARLVFSGSYRESDVNDISEIDDLTGEDLVLDGGRRQSTNASLLFESGLQARFGVTLALGYADSAYTDTQAASLVDSTRRNASLGLRFDLTRTAVLNLTTSYVETDEQDSTARDERQYRTGVGLDLLLNPSLRLSTGLSLSRNEVEETILGVRTRTTDEAPTFDLGLLRVMRNGTASATLGSVLTSTGTQTTLTLGRAMDLRAGKFSATIGATETGEGEIRGIGSLAFERAFKTGTLSTEFVQSVSTTTDDIDEQNSLLRIGYSHALTPVSGLTLGVTIAQSDRVDPAFDDYRRASAELVYARDVTEDWAMNVGYRHSISRESNTDPVVENRVFATIDRRFSLRP